MDTKLKKVRLVVLIQIVIALFFVIGAGWAGEDVDILFHSYFADIFLPFGFYFLLFMAGDKSRFFDMWWKRVIAVFTLVSISETLQYFGIYALAIVFDPIDYVMYGVGVLLAAFIDRKIFTKTLNFWV